MLLILVAGIMAQQWISEQRLLASEAPKILQIATDVRSALSTLQKLQQELLTEEDARTALEAKLNRTEAAWCSLCQCLTPYTFLICSCSSHAMKCSRQ